MSVYIGENIASNVEDYVDKEKQVQGAGIDLTINKISKFESSGSLGFENYQRNISRTKSIAFDSKGSVWLGQGTYVIDLNETVTVPANNVAIALPRSSLLRMGATIETALWDPGYKGKGQVLLVVHNEFGITLYKNTRLLQLVYMELNMEATKLYKGEYQHFGI